MARYVDAIDFPFPIEEAFDYMADFTRVAEWDPGVSSASRLTGGPLQKGSRFLVEVAFLGRRIPMEYEITHFDPPHSLILQGGDGIVTSIDEISFSQRGAGTRVTYEAQLEWVGVLQLADPILDLLFQRIGRVATRGLRERLAAESAVRARKVKPRKASSQAAPSKALA